MPEPEFVDPNSDDVVGALLPPDRRIGLDTEFMREKTFYPQLCLMQIATEDGIYCVDPLDASNLDSFWNKLMHCQWIVHSARQDIEVIYHTADRMPDSIFDTQIAAALLGYAPQLGYAGLVEELFDVELAKSHTRTDWTRRPLSSAAIEYAAEDVEYLLAAYDTLTERLNKLGRLQWAEEDSLFLLQPSLYKGDFRDAVNRLKGAKNLRGHARAAAARLASWRESEAVRTDRPRQWIMKDAVLLEIASANPKDFDSLSTIKGLAPKTLHRASKTILSMLEDAKSDNFDYEPPRKPDERQKAILKDMQSAVSACAEHLNITAEIIAPRKELSASLNGSRDSRVFTGWRRELIGDALLEMLEN
jgi:ribonuclease D